MLKTKIGSDGRIDKFKACCCVLGFRQTTGLDFNPDNVYSPMTEPTTIRTLLAIANKLNLNVDHLDIGTAFLNGILPPDEQCFCSPPPGFWPARRLLLEAQTRPIRWVAAFRAPVCFISSGLIFYRQRNCTFTVLLPRGRL